jgi:NAD(P) transhydrogenase
VHDRTNIRELTPELVGEPVDLVVIGSGPAGEKGAVHAALHGKRVAVVESLCPPRDTYSGRSGSSRTTIATSVVTPVAGFVATTPLTVTRRSATSSLACSRERARPRRTSSASSRSRRGGIVL